MAEKQSVSLEDYLEAVFQVSRKEGVARISTISIFLGVTKPSVSYAINKLVEEGLVRHDNYSYVELTPEGHALARKIVEKHQLLTVFFTEILGVERQEAEKEACSMEHYLDAETKDKLEGLVGFILSGPGSNEWLKNLRYYQENRKRPHNCPERCAAVEKGQHQQP